ncbi:adenylate/guanylate cyclase domain-containing protein [Mesorhizobium sp. M1365]|uniref:adenylate/guanylate cyclase domain-containing protein n=1 Tax=Mesorhizobium sp. M1365 TaxID=2957090 RepID=UPI003336D392
MRDIQRGLNNRSTAHFLQSRLEHSRTRHGAEMVKGHVQRKLAAILVADAVGYSSLMASDEVGTHERFKSLRSDPIDTKIAEHQGRIVKEIGDGLLVEFASVVAAVQCAVEIQEALAERNADRPDHKRIEFRIGIHLGDVIVDGEDIFGDGVNIAARLEGLAAPGGIAISADVRRQVEKKLNVDFEDIGEKELKNISEPVHVYRMKLALKAIQKPVNVLDRPAVAVLPFLNMSGDPEQDYFVDGLTEDIITALSHWRTFPVIARNSTFTYKSSAVDVRKIARELDARFVLEGGVRKAASRIRVTAQLIDAARGHHVWAEKYDRHLTDIFELQDELTQKIAAVVEPAITRAETRRMAVPGTKNVGAWDYYLRGLGLAHQFTGQAHKQARDMFRRALEIDPAYSQAYTGIAQTYLQEIFLKQVDDHAAAVSKVVDAAKKAVSLDDSDSAAHLSLGLGYMWSGMHDAAIEEVQRAIDCNPSNALAYVVLGNVLDVAGRPEEGIPFLETGLRLNPLEPRMHYAMTWLGGAYLNARRYADALAWLQRAASRRSDYALTFLFLAVCLTNLGKRSAAEKALAECEKVEPGFTAAFVRWRAYRNDADNDHMLKGIRDAGGDTFN